MSLLIVFIVPLILTDHMRLSFLSYQREHHVGFSVNSINVVFIHFIHFSVIFLNVLV
jgi:hypothetical protein